MRPASERLAQVINLHVAQLRREVSDASDPHEQVALVRACTARIERTYDDHTEKLEEEQREKRAATK